MIFDALLVIRAICMDNCHRHQSHTSFHRCCYPRTRVKTALLILYIFVYFTRSSAITIMAVSVTANVKMFGDIILGIHDRCVGNALFKISICLILEKGVGILVNVARK